ncbi:MAG: hypothetical protein ACNS60_14025 [Candidatus Cyclobacteriaceae bacterium M2_1C_046]
MRKIILGLLLLSSLTSTAQLVDPMEEDESKFYVQTKQVNQFFRRFNGEESEKGNRYYKNDKQFRNERLRKKYLNMLFDESNTGISNNQKREFISAVTDESPAFLDFHKDGWVAEVNTKFNHKGKEQNIILFMKLEAENLGYKWIIDKVYFEPLLKQYQTDTTTKFLHPMSHELYFLNLRKVFEDPSQAVKYTSKDWEPDQLTLFLQEIRNGNLKFKTVSDLKFHFFQIPGWYFELSEFRRPGYNTGWLISNLMKLNSEEEKELMKDYIFHENQ